MRWQNDRRNNIRKGLIMFTELWEALAPSFIEALGAIITLMFGWLSVTLHRKWGIEIEARHREALHLALMTGARAAIDGNLSGVQARSMVMDYVRQSVPDALGYLMATDSVLMRLAEAKIQQLLGKGE